MDLVCQGIEGSYSYQVSKIFKKGLEKEFNIKINKIKPVNSFEELFKEVEKGNFGAIPVENSLIGTIFNNYETIIKKNLRIVYDYYLKIEHCLLVKKDIKNLSEIKKVISHPAAIEQCKNFLIKNNLNFENFEDTASAARFVSESSEKIAAIASREAALQYGLKVLKENIQDLKNNYTRFFLINKDYDYIDLKGKKETIISSFSFTLQDKPASLFKALMPFATYFVNLTKIESKLIKESPFNYEFILEGEISKTSRKFKDLFEELKFFTKNLKLISSFRSLNLKEIKSNSYYQHK